VAGVGAGVLIVRSVLTSFCGSEDGWKRREEGRRKFGVRLNEQQEIERK
jgi:hypothetical protein